MNSTHLIAPNRDLIALVEDDPRLRDLLERYLDSQGFRVCAVANLAGLKALFKVHHVDLVVLDLNLPDGDGLTACRELRGQQCLTPIIMLTARSEEIDRIIGLEMGADDYLGKPLNPRELVARIRAVLRRRNNPAPASATLEGPIHFGDCMLEPTTRILRNKGTHTHLTSGEFALLHIFVKHPHRPLSRDQLLNLARGRDYASTDRSIDVMVTRLRRLIEADPKHPKHLQTVWGMGYVFVPST